MKAIAVVMVIHGRNQTTDYSIELIKRLNLPQVHCIAPQAAENSWYPNGFMAQIEENEPHLSYALESYRVRISQVLARGIDQEKLVLIGFSQGACLTAEYVYRNHGRYGGVVLFTGGLIGPKGISWDISGDLQGTPVFLGSSDVDEWVPEDRVLETAEVFKQMEAKVKTTIYKDMDHTVNDIEIEEARKIIRNVLQNNSKKGGR